MVNLTSANEHIPKIEQRIRVLKERYSATSHSLPLMRLPVILTINMVLNNVNLLVYFPTTAGNLTAISPRAIITGETLNYKSHLAITFGQYFHIYEEDIHRNSKGPCTRVAICMVSEGNKQGGLKFMTLGSMKNVVRRSWYEIPMPDTLIARVNALSQGQLNDLDFLD